LAVVAQELQPTLSNLDEALRRQRRSERTAIDAVKILTRQLRSLHHEAVECQATDMPDYLALTISLQNPVQVRRNPAVEIARPL
jgi:hypothetical protein